MTPPFGPFVIGDHTHPGPRDTNQDTVLSIALPDDRWLVAVADGMGGLEDGELASKTALSALYKTLTEGGDLAEAVQDANAAVVREAQGRVMGTTLVAAVVTGTSVEIVNVGDSRAYLSDLLGLMPVTQDHTMAYEAERNGSIPFMEAEDESGRWAGALARYLGAGEELETDRFGPLDLLDGGWLLLCSDGLHGVMSLDEIDVFLAGQSDAVGAAEGLVEEALQRGTEDNVSAVLLHWPDSSPAPTVRSPRQTSATTRRKESVLIGTPGGRSKHPKKTTKGWVLKVFLIVVPLMIGLVFLLDWILSN